MLGVPVRSYHSATLSADVVEGSEHHVALAEVVANLEDLKTDGG